MSFGQGYSTTTKHIFLCLFLTINVTMQQFAEDVTYLSGSSGEFTSPGYPNTPSVFVGWNITVDEDHQILLQFLDFELVERNPCSLDNFELFDSMFVQSSLRGRWCWDSFDKLNPTTYISNSNIFLLRLRTLLGGSRKGFKANYSSIPKEATTIASADITQTKTPGKSTNAPSTSTQNVPKEATTASQTTVSKTTTTTTTEVLRIHSTSTPNAPRKSPTTSVLNIIPTTTLGEKLSGSTKSSTGIIVAIVTSAIVAFILIAALIVWKYKINNLTRHPSYHDPSKSLPRGNISTEMYEVVKEEKVHDIESNYENTEGREEKSIPATDISTDMQQLGVKSIEIIREGDTNTPDGTYETPDVKVYTYADPNEMKFCVHDIESNYENTEGREEKSIPATNIPTDMQQLGVKSKEIVRGDKNTPDGTYETPDVKVYTYADPNEMKFCVTK